MALRSRQTSAHGPYRKPLFDRLQDTSIQSSVSYERGGQQRALLMESILLDLQRLLNTRRERTEPLSPATATVLDYGVPNFTPMSSLQDVEKLGNLIANAIQIFEPRLIAPRVVLRPMEGRPDKVLGEIAGSIQIGGHVESFSFPLTVDPQVGAAQILPSPAENS